MTPSSPLENQSFKLRWVISHPLVLPCLLLAIQTIPGLWAKDVWFSDEARHAAVLLQLIEHGHWLVLYLGEEFYPDKPPLYFWVLATISWVTGTTGPFVFMAGAALSAFAFLIATIRCAEGFGTGRAVALLSGLLLVGNFYFVERAHFPRMDLLFATYILLSHFSFYRAVFANSPTALNWFLCAFFFAALATLTKGPVGLVLPIVGVVAFLAFEGRLKTLIGRPLLLGSLAFLIPVALYLLGVYLLEGWAFLHAIFIDQTLQRALSSPRLAGPVYYYLHKLPEIFLPWSLMILFLPWRRLASNLFQVRGGKQQSSKSKGVSYVFISALTSLIVISGFDYKITFLLITLLPQVAILSALAINRLSRRRRTYLFALITLVYVVALALIPFAAEFTLWPERVRGEIAVAISMVPLIAGMLITVKKRALIFCTVVAVGSTLVSLPYFLITVRDLDTVMATRQMGETLGRAKEIGAEALYFHPFRSGIFDYHSKSVIPYQDSLPALAGKIRASDCGLVAMRTIDWQHWEEKPANLVLLKEQRLDYEIYVLLGWGDSQCQGKFLPTKT